MPKLSQDDLRMDALFAIQAGERTSLKRPSYLTTRKNRFWYDFWRSHIRILFPSQQPWSVWASSDWTGRSIPSWRGGPFWFHTSCRAPIPKCRHVCRRILLFLHREAEHIINTNFILITQKRDTSTSATVANRSATSPLSRYKNEGYRRPVSYHLTSFLAAFYSLTFGPTSSQCYPRGDRG